MSNQPKPKCFLCDCTDPNYLVYFPQLQIYLCTKVSDILNKSHFVYVLKRFHIYPISKGPMSPNITCEKCRQNNPFLLGFVGPNNRRKCICQNCLKKDSDPKIFREFTPIIVNSQFIHPWYSSQTPDEPIKNEDPEQLTNSIQNLADRVMGTRPQTRKSVQLNENTIVFQNFTTYKRAMTDFVNEECSLNRTREKVIVNVNNATWKRENKVIFRVTTSISKALTLGAKVNIYPANTDQSNIYKSKDFDTGFVLDISKRSDITVAFNTQSRFYNQRNFVCLKLFSDVPYERQLTALNQFKDPFFAKFFCKNLTSEEYNTPVRSKINLVYDIFPFSPNKDQKEAIIDALSKKFAMIQGPPGTGKTTCLVFQAYSYMMAGYNVLIATHSNKAADHIAEIMAKYNVSAIRVPGLTYQKIAAKNKKIAHMVSSSLAGNRFQETKLIKESKIVIATTVTTGCKRFINSNFPKVIIDEGNQLVDPELLIPLLHGCDQLTIYGDYKQITPYVFSKNARDKKYDISLVHRLPMDVSIQVQSHDGKMHLRKYQGFIPKMLRTQYRMHPIISQFPSMLFYNGLLKDGVTEKQRTNKYGFPPLFFFDVSSPECYSHDGKSLQNYGMAFAAADVVKQFHQRGIPAEEIGIITFYSEMVGLIRDTLHNLTKIPENYCDEIRVDTVDAFEGSDINFVILITVRSNSRKSNGFICNEGRMNVALSRAKYVLTVIGNKDNLINDDKWKQFIQYCQNKQCIA